MLVIVRQADKRTSVMLVADYVSVSFVHFHTTPEIAALGISRRSIAKN